MNRTFKNMISRPPKLKSCLTALLAVVALSLGLARSQAQALRTVDPSAPWIGYMNVFQLPADGGPANPLTTPPLFGYVVGTSLLQANFGTTNLTLNPCRYVWETLDTSYVKGDGVTPNVNMDANFYVEDSTLLNTNVIFTGLCRSNTLTTSPEPYVTAYNDAMGFTPTNANYSSFAFIKVFDGGYALLGYATSNLLAGQSFSVTMDTAAFPTAAHVQYGFETFGPDQSTNYPFASRSVVIAAAGQSALVTVDPSQAWLGYMNWTELNGSPVIGSGSVWGVGELRSSLTSSNLTLSPCTNVWETADTFWVQPDGMTPNKVMDASFYVENNNLANTNLIFIGTCLSNTLTAAPEPLTGISYTSAAFIKIFDGSYNLLGSASSGNLVPGQPFAISLNTAGAAHVQYGFETVGPDANPATAGSLGNVVLAAAIPPSPAPTLTNAAPTPTHPQSSVLAMYNSSGVYTNHPVERWLATWSGAAETTYTIPGTGRTVLKYSNLQYAGVEFYDTSNGDNTGGTTDYSIDASPYDTFHVDLWTPNANQFGIQLVSLNPTTAPQVNFTPASGTITNYGWVSLDIPLSTFTGINPAVVMSHLQQLLWIDNQAGGGFTGGTFYIDNVYFYNSAAISAPTLTASTSGGNLQLHFSTQTGASYDVQYKTNLTDAVWLTLTSVTGDGTVQTVTDPATQKSRFYRIYAH